MNRKTILSVKGIHTPRLLIWMKGFLHGTILHSSALDPDTKIITSGYITGQIKRYRMACVACRKKAEKELSDKWSEADQLLIDYAEVTSFLSKSEHDQNYFDENTSSACARAKQRAADERASREADRQAILKAAASIINDINGQYVSAHDQMEATAEALLSTFSAYGHGVLLKPVFTCNLPVLSYEDCADQIISNHQNTWNALLNIIEEVK